MFEVGASYQVTLVQEVGGTENVMLNMRVVEVELPLVKFQHFDEEIIINTSSPHFISARRA